MKRRRRAEREDLDGGVNRKRGVFERQVNEAESERALLLEVQDEEGEQGS